MGLPRGASGLLVSGGSMANLVGLTVARDRRAGGDVGKEGLHALPQPLRIYCSSETHNSVDKAMGVLGLGASSLARIPVDDAFRIDVRALERAIAADRANGVRPVCIIGNAGTVNTGSIDDLPALRAIADREGMWLHVDGAFGALAMLPESTRPLVKGVESADSLAFDLHKWMYMPYEAGCVFIRRVEDHRGIFAPAASYLAKDTRGIATGSDWFSDRGVQLTRGFRALKIWMSLKEHGIDKYARLIEQNVMQARYVDRLIRAEKELEILAPTALNIVCLRYRGKGASDETLDALNREILLRIQESGFAVLSPTKLKGRYAIRIAVTNHRSRTSDFDEIVAEILKLGREESTKLGVKSA
jgi:glutamate/tyrosine decarboxylase-like PLP-dependent enzyme